MDWPYGLGPCTAYIAPSDLSFFFVRFAFYVFVFERSEVVGNALNQFISQLLFFFYVYQSH